MKDKEQDVFAQAAAQMHKAFPPIVRTGTQKVTDFLPEAHKALIDALERVLLDPAIAVLPPVEQARLAALLVIAESAAGPSDVLVHDSKRYIKIDPHNPENYGSVNPGVEALKKLEGRQVAMLGQHELELLREFMDQGRKHGVLVEFDTDTDVLGWSEMNSARALEILAAANSYIRLQIPMPLPQASTK